MKCYTDKISGKQFAEECELRELDAPIRNWVGKEVLMVGDNMAIWTAYKDSWDQIMGEEIEITRWPDGADNCGELYPRFAESIRAVPTAIAKHLFPEYDAWNWADID